MDITFGLPTMLPHGRIEELAWYRKIDEGPWHGLATVDRLTYPVGWSLVPQLAAAAAMTERVRLWTAVAVTGLRHPVLFAKDLATIDVLSGGRLTLGVGIGGYDEDYAAVDSDPTLKHQRLDAQVRTIRRIWAQEPPIEGRHPVGPRPLQTEGIPVMAGVRGPKALARAAKWATGVIDPNNTVFFDPEDLAVQRDRVVQAWKDAGRTDTPHFSACAWFALGPNAKEQLGAHMSEFFEGSGDPEAIRSIVENSPHHGVAGVRNIVSGARAAGLDNIILCPTTADPGEIDRTRDALGI